VANRVKSMGRGEGAQEAQKEHKKHIKGGAGSQFLVLFVFLLCLLCTVPVLIRSPVFRHPHFRLFRRTTTAPEDYRLDVECIAVVRRTPSHG